MSIREKALKEILRKKLDAEIIAEKNINEALKDEDIKLLFVKCKRLIVDIAKKEVDGNRADDLREDYNATRDVLAKLLKSRNIDKSTLSPKYSCVKCKDTGMLETGERCQCFGEITKEKIKQTIKQRPQQSQ